MKISEVLLRDRNNLDLIRIILASMVIIGHVFALNGFNVKWYDPVNYFFPYLYSGSLAVQMFFFISGLLVTTSLFRSQSPTKFIISRLFRLVPALAFVIIITVFIIGPVLTTFNLSTYFHSPLTYNYLQGIKFIPQEVLPGVFENNLYKNVVNGSLWTLPKEMYCYIVLLCIFLITQRRAYLLWNILFFAILIDSVLPNKILFGWLGENSELNILPLCFALGVFFANNADKISINLQSLFGSILVMYFFKETPYAHIILIFTSAIVILYLASNKYVIKFKPKYDISYGIYLWGFLVQQTIYFYIGQVHPLLHMTIALFITTLLAIGTHLLVEKRFIRWGAQLSKTLLIKYSFLT